MIEEYRDIPGYEGYYQVSNLGNVKSLGAGKVMKPHNFGCVNLKGPKGGKRFRISSLVAAAFLGLNLEDRKHQIKYLNRNRNDYYLDNLVLEPIIPKEKTSYKEKYEDQEIKQSGVTNVNWNKQNQSWCILIKNDKKGIYKHLGYYKHLEDAIALRNLFYNSFYSKKKPECEYPGLLYLEGQNKWHLNVFDSENNIYHIDEYINEADAKKDWLLYTDLLNHKH